MSVVEIFIAYSHNDLRHKDELKKFLRPLLNTGRARVWDDYDIEAGKDWEAEIKKRLYGADIIILLVSPDSLASDYFYGNEVSVSLERHSKGEAVVIPIILRPCAWILTPLGSLEALPEKGKPVTKYDLQDEAFTEIAHRLDDTIQQISILRLRATERENQYRKFEAVAHTAEHLFHKGEWVAAKNSYLEAIQLHASGFIPGIDQMRRQIEACEKQESQLLIRQAFETRLAEFNDKIQEADSFFRLEKWKEAKAGYGELIKLHETGFPGDTTEFRRRQFECEQGIQELERIAREEKQRHDSYQKQMADGYRFMRKRLYYQALESARTALAIKPDSPESLKLIRDAEAGIERMPEEQRIARKRTAIIAGIAVVVLIIAGFVYTSIQRKLEAKRKKEAFQLALSVNKLPTWRNFIQTYPTHENAAQANDSIRSLEVRIKLLDEEADFYLRNAMNANFANYRSSRLQSARNNLQQILKYDSTNSQARQKLAQVPER